MLNMARIVINRILSFFSIIAATIILALSCTKDDEVVRYFYPSEVGDTHSYYAYIDGASLVVKANGETYDGSAFYKDILNPEDSLWNIDIDWLRVYYIPAKRELFLSVDQNTTGIHRTAIVMGQSTSGKSITIIVSQAG